MKEIINNLIEISRYFGKNKEYVIAGGGNTSAKTSKYLWIKASGFALSDISEEGFVCLSREMLKVISEKKYSNNPVERENEVKNDLNAAVISKGKRPSVETSMHDIINYTFVVHTHPTLVNALMCSLNAKQIAAELFGNEMLFIEYTDPGYVLFKKVETELKSYKNKYNKHPHIVLLENHGIFVSANNTDDIKKIYSEIENKIYKWLKTQLPKTEITEFEIDKSLFKKIEPYKNYEILSAKCDLIDEFVKDNNSFKEIETAFTPDHIVYCKSRYLFIEKPEINSINEKINNFKNKYGYAPKIIGIKNQGLICIDENKKSTETVLELIMNMMKIAFYARSFGGSKPMTNEQIAFIENWEVENYRRSIAKKI
jgi:rhamnose utilization protein RhaD (predicted bifunctional aldolase and dehydrogenase)